MELNGKYFTAHVQQGDSVKKGQTLITFDLEQLKAEGYDTQIPVIITNSDQYQNIEMTTSSKTQSQSLLFSLK